MNIVKWDSRGRVLFVATLVASAGLVVVATSNGVRAIEAATIARVQTERETAAEQAAGRLAALLDKIRWRISDHLGRQAAGVEPARSRDELRDALGRLAKNLPLDDVALFVQERNGRLVAVDPRHSNEKAEKMAEHRHAIPADTSAHSHVQNCPVCAEHEHSISLVEPLSDDRWLGASIRIDRVGAELLGGMTQSGGRGVCIERNDGLRIVCRGDLAEQALTTFSSLKGYPLRVRTSVTAASIAREQRGAFSALLVTSLLALALLGGAAGLALWLSARRRRTAVATMARLAEVDKLASIGTLAAETVHELANPLTAAKANIELWQPMDDEAKAARDDSILALIRVREIVDELRRYSRREHAGPTSVFDLREPVAAALRLARPKTRHRCRVETRVAEPVWVRGHASHVSQIVVNLLTNASQAFNGHRPDDNLVVVSAAARNGTVDLVVEDNGPGVAPEHVPRLFTPFFTTKGPDEGTGLGLAVSTRLASEGGGRLRYEPGRTGARFVLEIKAAHDVVSNEEAK
ncbi:MAG: HAMP domain-containing histidine kinase [Deltaproteobacteria bacterium]|nr:HAMP domain-containing histidine kinase [Deltaproteobacteria bacterium]